MNPRILVLDDDRAVLNYFVVLLAQSRRFEVEDLSDSTRAFETLAARDFDLILLDPPYAEPDLEAVVARAGAWLAPDGLLVLEHARRRAAPLAAGHLTRTRLVPSGDSALSFYERTTTEPGPDGDEADR